MGVTHRNRTQQVLKGELRTSVWGDPSRNTISCGTLLSRMRSLQRSPGRGILHIPWKCFSRYSPSNHVTYSSNAFGQLFYHVFIKRCINFCTEFAAFRALLLWGESEVLLKPLYFIFKFFPKQEGNLFTMKSLNFVCQKQQHYPDLFIYQLYINSWTVMQKWTASITLAVVWKSCKIIWNYKLEFTNQLNQADWRGEIRPWEVYDFPKRSSVG